MDEKDPFGDDKKMRRLYTNLTIRAKGKNSLKKYLLSLVKGLPEKWIHQYKAVYPDKDTFKIVKNFVCIETPKYLDTRESKPFKGTLWIGQIHDYLSILRIDLDTNGAAYKDEITIGFLLERFYRAVLRKHPDFDQFDYQLQHLGQNDLHWNVQDIREERPYVMYTEDEKKIYILAKNEKALLQRGKEVQFNPPNSISISLSVAKKNYNIAQRLFKQMGIMPDKPKELFENSQLIYDYLESIQTAILFYYTAIEAFCNAAIPPSFEFSLVNSRGIKEVWNKSNLERWMSTSDKITQVLPKVLNTKDIKAESYWSEFKELEEVRNSLVHQKTKEENNAVDSSFLHRLLNERIFKILESAIKVIDFYYHYNPAYAYFPFGIGYAKPNVIRIESFEKHFRVIEE